jgi:[acyl-carrier-protein] S-malonyltransferase
MEEAKKELALLINNTSFNTPSCPIYQCVDGMPHTDIGEIRNNLIKHITHPVLWTSMVRNMSISGVQEYYEVGPDDTLQKIVSRMNPDKKVCSLLEVQTYLNINN